jgi:hypothetical protein
MASFKSRAGAAADTLSRRLGAGVTTRLQLGLARKPAYAHCVYHSALLARRLRYPRISVLEFGVAGGNGLVALERYAHEVSRELGVKIDVYGFDTGTGLPPPRDYRDLPYHWQEGFFRMDEDALRSRLTTAQLVLGDIRETAKTFFSDFDPAPIAAVCHDFDLYSSTKAALSLFDCDEKYRLPRIYCYFDDILGGEVEAYNDFTGERLAIAEFNHSHEMMKLSESYNLTTRRNAKAWYHQIFVLHDFAHGRYNDFVSDDNQQLPLY